MAGVGKRFTKGDPRIVPGRRKGSKNKWRKAELDKLREHLQNVLDEHPGGVEAFLKDLMRYPKAGWPMFVSLLRDQSPKPPAAVEVDANVTVRWQDEAPAEEKPK